MIGVFFYFYFLYWFYEKVVDKYLIVSGRM